jgi:hypothetical protein
MYLYEGREAVTDYRIERKIYEGKGNKKTRENIEGPLVCRHEDVGLAVGMLSLSRLSA